jgi:GLTT repeat (6 copies)
MKREIKCLHFFPEIEALMKKRWDTRAGKKERPRRNFFLAEIQWQLRNNCFREKMPLFFDATTFGITAIGLPTIGITAIGLPTIGITAIGLPTIGITAFSL